MQPVSLTRSSILLILTLAALAVVQGCDLLAPGADPAGPPPDLPLGELAVVLNAPDVADPVDNMVRTKVGLANVGDRVIDVEFHLWYAYALDLVVKDEDGSTIWRKIDGGVPVALGNSDAWRRLNEREDPVPIAPGDTVWFERIWYGGTHRALLDEGETAPLPGGTYVLQGHLLNTWQMGLEVPKDEFDGIPVCVPRSQGQRCYAGEALIRTDPHPVRIHDDVPGRGPPDRP